jgi:hypothetical protein
MCGTGGHSCVGEMDKVMIGARVVDVRVVSGLGGVFPRSARLARDVFFTWGWDRERMGEVMSFLGFWDHVRGNLG